MAVQDGTRTFVCDYCGRQAQEPAVGWFEVTMIGGIVTPPDHWWTVDRQFCSRPCIAQAASSEATDIPMHPHEVSH